MKKKITDSFKGNVSQTRGYYCNYAPLQAYTHAGEEKQSGTNERKHKTIKMLIVLCGTNMWRGESGGLP